MTSTPLTAPTTIAVADAARRIWSGGFMPLPLVDEDGRLAGVVSAQDVLRAVAQRLDLQRTSIMEIATTQLPTVTPDSTVQEAAAAVTASASAMALVTDNGHLSGVVTQAELDAYRLIESELGPAAADVVTEVSPNDLMYGGSWGAYAYAGISAVQCIRAILRKLGRESPAGILDLPCGHGRELRFLKVAFPEARFGACDIDADGVEFCARVFGAEPTISQVDPRTVSFPRRYELAWCGSLFTHLAAERWRGFLDLFARALEPGGLLMFSTNGFLETPLLRKLGLDADEAQRLTAEFRETGIGYVDVGDGSWGLTLARPGWVKAQVEDSPLEFVSFERWAWKPPSPAQDVVVCTRAQP
jgi:SAM-dependent methyltransferase